MSVLVMSDHQPHTDGVVNPVVIYTFPDWEADRARKHLEILARAIPERIFWTTQNDLPVTWDL